MSTWIDFAELRQKLDFAAVLRHYGVELKIRRGVQHQGFCPLPTHKGERRSPSFSANLEKKAFHCFGCQAKGNVIEFAARMEGFDPDDPRQLRQAALRLVEYFGVGNGAGDAPHRKQNPPVKASDAPVSDPSAQQNAEPAVTDSAIVNAPLDFTLRKLDVEHAYLKARGLTAQTIEHFGLGYCSRGLMQGRIAIPLHDPEGRLIGYAGRIVDDSRVSPDCPKYLFPSPRKREGKEYVFRKSCFLYHGHALSSSIDEIIVVEGFPACWWLWQHGYTNVVALMGASCSVDQAWRIICSITHAGRVWVMPDHDEAGERCAHSVLSQVCPHRFCRWLKPDQSQPTDCTAVDLARLFQREVAP